MTLNAMEIGALILLGFGCWVVSSVVLMRARHRYADICKRAEVKRRYSEPEQELKNEPEFRPTQKQMAVQTSFDDQRIGRLP